MGLVLGDPGLPTLGLVLASQDCSFVSVFLGNKTRVGTWLRYHPASGEGKPDITGGTLLQTPGGGGEAPSGLCPLEPPGHHQHGLARSKHHPGRANGHGPEVAREVKGNLRQKTKRISEWGAKVGGTEATRETNSSGF